MTGDTTRPKASYFVLGVTIVVCGLQLSMPNVLTLWESWIGWPLIEAPLGIWAFLALRRETAWGQRPARRAMVALQVALMGGLVFNTSMLLTLLWPDATPTALRLLTSATAVIVMNVLVFALIFWWNDSGGPLARRNSDVGPLDLGFPQQESGSPRAGWRPQPGDYLYTAYTNVFAFSPTDTMPLTGRAKLAFTVQSGLALMTITVVLGLAVNLMN